MSGDTGKQEPYGYVWLDKNMEQRFSRMVPKSGNVGEVIAVYSAAPVSVSPDKDLFVTLYKGLVKSGWFPPEEARRWQSCAEYAHRRFKEETGKDLQVEAG